MPNSPSPEKLTAALVEHQIELLPEQIALLARYCELLWEWNAKINLTRHTDHATFVARDLVDSLALSEFLDQGERVLDVGSGGGVPGMVLAILRPDLKIALCESVGKKAKVLDDIVERLGLDVPVHHARAEALLERERFDTLVVRAVARMRKLLGWFRGHQRAFGRLLLIKGPSWVEERGEARHHGELKHFSLRRLKSYPMAGAESESVVLQICPVEKRK